MKIKKIGTQGNREVYEATIRRNYVAEDYAEVLMIQEASCGKKRFVLQLEDFSGDEVNSFMAFINFTNSYRNACVRKGYQVIVQRNLLTERQF